MLSTITSALVASLAFSAFAASAHNAPRQPSALQYEYIVVGSGAGGGPVAARLALAGRKVLLIDAGDDQGANQNYSVPAYQAKSTEDPALGWEFFVRHYKNDTQQMRDYKLVYNLPNGSTWNANETGHTPPPGVTIKGILYPRTATLGGCTAHNALVTIYPFRSDFDNLAALTGDSSWSASNLRKYWERLENAYYVPPPALGHGKSGWFGVQEAPISLALGDPQVTSLITGAATALGNGTQIFQNYVSLLSDANQDSTSRDHNQALYQIPIATNGNYVRNGAREFVLSVANAKNADGSKKYPLDIRLNCFVTNVTFDKSVSPPRATGVNFLDGKYLYKAAILNSQASPGTPGSAQASREVIVAGGSYNSPQILKLSGVGPAAELSSFGIPVIADLPGVGANLQDHYEVTVQGKTPADFKILNGCNFAMADKGKPIPFTSDPCYNDWASRSGQLSRGTYSSSGFAAGMMIKTGYEPDNNWGLLGFGGPVDFRGYYPGYSYDATSLHNWWTWAIIKSHPRNHAGTVTLRSANPLDVPNINFNYFNEGSGDYQDDINQIVSAIQTARNALKNQAVNITEILPGPNVVTPAQVAQYVRDTAWGHHCSSTCAIGADSNPMAVLDSSFRVRKVQGLRVVDASTYPNIPGTFTAASTYLVGEKAADVILSQEKST